ncbi:hypothetical protein JAAARDRAFT_32097 [Jaapia argillacea MUCL 33604]|uniref:Uncharacterized protein n=1 Tax=Jaapia argillacea MUCL 33604 TaxID=933084 RepID=A0A067Q4K4_9AGAM|nr:hypothetical protein JAAARDRAFT_32097 [Jaapia argillacea MUCL 33604]
MCRVARAHVGCLGMSAPAFLLAYHSACLATLIPHSHSPPTPIISSRRWLVS